MEYTQQTLRIMSAMVLFAFEQDLSRYIASKIGDTGDLSTIGNILELQEKPVNGRERQRESTSVSLADAYLDEIFRGALNVAKNTSNEADLMYLKKLFSNLSLFSVRNSVAHPNKPFLLCYWHRVATLATDPATERLGFRATIDGYGLAQKGELVEVPDYWYSASIEIPNNLPNETGHELTGLIGRKQELAELSKLLKNPRIPLVAVVAPGGVGKTALTLDYLHTLVLDESYIDHVSLVIYISLKLEKLTPDGIVQLSAIESIAELINQIEIEIRGHVDTKAISFDELKQELGAKQVLLCIDNLETLLRDSPEKFEGFNYSLPASWRVLVTSRVAVSSAAILLLGPLQKSAGQHLVRNYSARRGISLAPDQVLSLAESCECNPLAIRLAVDLLARGIEINEALSQSKKDLGEFSYRVLLDCLSDEEVDVLESLMAQQPLDRRAIAEYASLTIDKTQEVLNSLLKTSLVTCSYEEEASRFSLPISVRDVLLTYSRAVERRKKHIATVAKSIARVQSKRIMHGPKAENPYSESYIPQDVSTKIQELAIKANNLIFQKAMRPESLGGLIIELRNALDSPASWFVWRILGRIHWKLADHDGWESAFTKSIELKPDPFSYFLLASRLYASGEYAQAEKIYAQLENDGFFNPERSNADFAHDVCTGYFLTKLFQGKFGEVLELTNKCAYPDLQSRYYLFRSGTYKRMAEAFPGRSAEYWQLMDEARVNLELAVQLDGYAKYVRKVLKNIIKSISISVKGDDFQELSVDAVVKGLLDFSARHILGAFSEGTETAADMRGVIRNFKSYGAANNIFVFDGKWDLLLESGEGEEREFGGYSEEGGMILAHLYNVANLNKGYAFGRDSAGHQYYLHVKEFQNGIDLFKGLANGQPVAIDCADVEAADGKASRARLWMVVE